MKGSTVTSVLCLLLFAIECCSATITIKCNGSVTLGDLMDVNNYKKSVAHIVEELFQINQTYNHFSRLENDLNEAILLDMHPFVGAIHLAYINHLKLNITPDMIWHLIASGTSHFINENAEELRGKFVLHQGKKTIVVRRDDFMFNSSTNEWNEVIDEFAEKVGQNTLANVSQLFDAGFSTTNKVNGIVSKIVLMESMQKYFQFEFVSLCAIPEINILGTVDDWILIKNKLIKLNETIPELSVWYDKLEPLLEKFIDVFQDKIDLEFWNQIYKVHGGSGGPYISGWTITFFPYLENKSKNYYVWNKSWQDAYDEPMFGGLVTSNFPATLSRVSFKWKYYNQEFDMLFLGGFMGINYDQELKVLNPVFGYSVCQDTK